MAEKKSKSDGLDDSLSEEFPSEEVLTDDDDELAKSSHSGGSMNAKRRCLDTCSPDPENVPFMVQSSPPRFISFEDLIVAADGVKNMCLAHEIAMNADFKLEKVEPPQESIEQQVKEVVHQAFWDAFQAKITEDPPDFEHAVILITELKEKLLTLLLPQHHRIKTQIEEVLDMQLLQQKLENGVFDIFYYSEYVINILSKLCAPARDNNIAKLRELKDVVPLFKAIFEMIEMMNLDMANFTIQQIRPYIQQQSQEYEKDTFQKILDKQKQAGIDGLEITRHWLHRSFEKLKAKSTSMVEGASEGSILTPAVILSNAYMDVLDWEDGKLFPETLVMDQSRFLALKAQIQFVSLITSVLLVTYNTIGESIDGVQTLKNMLKDQISTLLDGVKTENLPATMANIGEQVNKCVEEFLRSHNFPARDETQQRNLKGQIKNLVTKDHPIMTIMSKRMMTFIQQALFSKPTVPLKVPSGMSVMEKELSQISGQFLRLISHNRSVFGSYYSDIIATLLKPEQQDSFN